MAIFGNLFDRLPDPATLAAGGPAVPSADELFDTLARSDRLLLQRIVSTGQSTPAEQWYDQTRAEWVVLLRGNAELSFEDGSRRRLNPGDYVRIAPHEKHRVESTAANEPTVWLALYYDDQSNENASGK
ncbi:MAG: cupin domain-containing protein [Planctomycetales bacterium]|nr:cupin domain-containing protein [Planctomycetales bacterium]